MTVRLGGLRLEYKLIQIQSRDAGPREARLRFDIGAGTQDLGFRGDLDILFACEAAVPVTLEVLDTDQRPTIASFVIRDEAGRTYPSSSRRLAPDFWFQPQVYRQFGRDGRPCPRSSYTRRGRSRGPEYEVREADDRGSESRQRIASRLPAQAAGSHLAKLGWFSGDHHIHARGLRALRAADRRESRPPT